MNNYGRKHYSCPQPLVRMQYTWAFFLFSFFSFLHIGKYVLTNDIYLPLFARGRNRNVTTSLVGVMNMWDRWPITHTLTRVLCTMPLEAESRVANVVTSLEKLEQIYWVFTVVLIVYGVFHVKCWMWKPSKVAIHPILLKFSLEERLIPRSKV